MRLRDRDGKDHLTTKTSRTPRPAKGAVGNTLGHPEHPDSASAIGMARFAASLVPMAWRIIRQGSLPGFARGRNQRFQWKQQFQINDEFQCATFVS
jgi:hypothetical protein